MKALIVREAGGLGDIICLSTPAQMLHNMGYEVYLLGMRGFEEVYRRLAGVDSFSVLDVSTDGVNRRGRCCLFEVPYFIRQEPCSPPDYLKSLILGYDIVLDLFCPAYVYEVQCLNEGKKVDKSRALIFGQSLIFHRSSIGRFAELVPPMVKFSDLKDKHLDINLPDKFVVLHIRGTDSRKNIPLEILAKICDSLPNINFIAVDCFRAPMITANNLLYLTKLTFEDLICLLLRAKLAVCIDSGILHLACALDVPTIGIFSATGTVTAELYRSCTPIQLNYHCSPCYYRGVCKKGSTCEAYFSDEQTIEKIINLIRRFYE